MNNQLLDEAFTRKGETDIGVTHNWRATVEGRQKEERGQSHQDIRETVWPYGSNWGCRVLPRFSMTPISETNLKCFI